MDDFTFVEPEGTSVEETFSAIKTQFGDGYAQTAPAGLNPLAQSWTLPWTDVDNAIATEMVAFFRAKAGQAFVWTPLWATTPIKVECERWTRTQGSKWGASNVTATFKQVFRP